MAEDDDITGGIQPVTCPACGGTGVYLLPDDTPMKCAEWDCNGTGQVMGFAVEVNGSRIESTEQLNE
ncbi:MAG: hypothetical protein U5L04_02465 [Trueperaceae bacterium]|nr:hypothetical protein [Trueperaceae bacterium]